MLVWFTQVTLMFETCLWNRQSCPVKQQFLLLHTHTHTHKRVAQHGPPRSVLGKIFQSQLVKLQNGLKLIKRYWEPLFFTNCGNFDRSAYVIYISRNVMDIFLGFHDLLRYIGTLSRVYWRWFWHRQKIIPQSIDENERLPILKFTRRLNTVPRCNECCFIDCSFHDSFFIWYLI